MDIIVAIFWSQRKIIFSPQDLSGRELKLKGRDLAGSPASCMNIREPDNFFFEMGPIRPPSEGRDHSLLIRPTRNCSWNRCEFCATYKGKKFSYRQVEEIKKDIGVAKTLHDEIKTVASRRGQPGRVTRQALAALWEENPLLYGADAGKPEVVSLRQQNLVNVANWLSCGAKSVFLQDADALIMRNQDLVAIIRYLKETFPTLERVTCYARSKSCLRKSPEELAELRAAGLSRLHVGLESGCDEVLAFMKKGVTAAEHLAGGRKVVEAGLSLSEYVMPGLGGVEWSERHALASAQVLSEIDPDFIRLRSLALRRHSPLLAHHEAGRFTELAEDAVVEEIGLFIENLHCHAYVTSDQMANLLYEVEGQLPQDKTKLLGVVSDYGRMLPLEKLAFRLRQRLLSFLSVYGSLPPELEERVQEAREALQKESPDAGTKVDAAVAALKEGFV